MIIRLFLICCFIFCGVASALAQHDHSGSSGEPTHICGTMEQDKINRARYPQLGTLEEFEEALQKKISEIRSREAAGRTQATIVSIPIVVHIVHNGEAIGTGTNLSSAQIQAQIEVLNEDFRRKAGTPGFNNHPSGADIEVEFCLSPIDKDGNPMTEPGVHRYRGSRAEWTREQIESELKPLTIWDPNLFYNVWTVKFAPSDANLVGYAQFPEQSGLAGLPDSGPANTDGVVIRHISFGSVTKGNFPIMEAPYNRGRTLTHETGHWLGLRHIWGDGNCADDFVSDTPPQASPSQGCPTGRISCNGQNMIENYMDYTNDACMNIFTEGQKTRMRAVLEVSPRRKNLILSNACNPQVDTIPTANFTVDKIKCVLLGSTVTFTDLSTNFPNKWNWTFEGGDPNSSTEKNPKVKYNTPGKFKVTLIATNSKGPSDTLIRNDYINVINEGLCRTFTNFEPGFTSTVLPLSAFGPYTGNLTGHNSIKSKAFSEFFLNDCGYKYVSGVNINFGALNVSNEEATVTALVWNARGPQGSPGAVIESKNVLLKQIKEDVANNKATKVIFDRETPVFSKPFHVGVEITYDNGYTLAIVSSANGEGTKATSWIRNEAGKWDPFTIAFGANIAMKIEPVVGMNPSVQVSASKLIVHPGEEVILNGKGASIFVWNAADGTVSNVAGPQLIVHPTKTTTYITTGSGLDLCNTTASTTIYAREILTGIDNSSVQEHTITMFPNPGTNQLNLQMENSYRGKAVINMISVLGNTVVHNAEFEKTEDKVTKSFDTALLRPGVYLFKIKLGPRNIIKKWVKY